VDTVGTLLAIIFLETPILLLSWLLIKVTRNIFYDMRVLVDDSKGKLKAIIKIILLIGIISILVISAGFFLIAIFSPDILAATPLALRLFFLFLILTVYGCFTAIFVGLGDAVGAGGSAGKVFKTLSIYLRETFQTKQSAKKNRKPQV
jgi:hypothetical protein